MSKRVEIIIQGNPQREGLLTFYILIALSFSVCIVSFHIPRQRYNNETRCYDKLGCLNINKSWYHAIYRPLNLFPLPRNVINTKFTLYTKKNPTQGQSLILGNNESIARSNFDPKDKIKFIIHGFLDSSRADWVKELKNELLKIDDHNVITVDWFGGSLTLYNQATANTRLVALEIANLVQYLQENYNVDLNKVHLIGHSLGAHTAGYAGEKLAGKIRRITGLDPAEPFFQGMPNHLRLDHTDAQLVDVIHTDGKPSFVLGYGMSSPCGHLDFYPNNGKDQPGCSIFKKVPPLVMVNPEHRNKLGGAITCNHSRAVKLFIDSINSECPYIAHKCGSYDSFLRGECFSCRNNSSLGCGIMGYYAVNSPALVRRKRLGQDISNLVGSKFFFATGKTSPYCRRHYRITIKLAKPPDAPNWVQGKLQLSLFSTKGTIRNMNLTPGGPKKLEHGKNKRMVIVNEGASTGEIGKIQRVELSWKYVMEVVHPESLCILWCNNRLYVNSITVDIMKLPTRGNRVIELSKKFCSGSKRNYVNILSGSKASFTVQC